MEDELKGLPVLVHPQLDFDPAAKQNEIGIIMSADIDNNDVFVSFEDRTLGLYSTDALLALLPAREIHQHVIDHAAVLAWPDLKVLTQIELMLKYGSEPTRESALKLAQQNQNIWTFCLDTIHNQLGPDQTKSRKR